MFYGCVSLKGQENTKFLSYHTNIEFAKVDGLEGRPGYFTGIWTLKEPIEAESDAETKSILIDAGFSQSDLEKVTKVEFVRQTPPTGTSAKSISNVPDKIKAELKTDSSTKEVVLTISSESMIYSRAKSCFHLFQNFKALKTVEFNDNLDTIASLTMQGMFEGCVAMQTLDLSSLRTGNVEDFSYMFEKFGNNKTNLNFLASNQLFDTNSAITFEGMFSESKLDVINIRNFVYYNADNLKMMFYKSTVSDINFYDEYSYKYIDSHIKADFTSMFEDCTNIKCLKLGGFVPGENSILKQTFKNCSNLEKIYIHDGFRED